MITEAGRADVGAFVARLLRLDPQAVVRLRPLRLYPGAAGLAELWAMLPFGVLAHRLAAYSLSRDPGSDVTVGGAALLASLESGAVPPRRDEAWRWPLPSRLGEVVEVVPEDEVLRVAGAASRTLRQVVAEGVGGRRPGERVVRDALLDHVPIVVTGPDGQRVPVGQRLVQAAVRMGFLRLSSHRPRESGTHGENSVTVRLAGRWIALECSYGSVWYLPTSSLHLS